MDYKALLPLVPEPIRDWYLSRKYSKQLRDWELGGKPLPPPHVVKQMVIRHYQEKYKIDTFFETGTYLGDMVYAQRKFFKEIFTIELCEELHMKSEKRLNKYKNINLIQGDSSIVLDIFVKILNNKAIFWLDGHYSGKGTAKGETFSPIVKELNAILDSKIEHVVLIDDARDFNGSNGYPTIDEVQSIIKEKGFPNSEIIVEDDIIRIDLKL